MYHPFISCARCAGFARINSGDDYYLILNFFLYSGKAADIIQHAILFICGTGADYKQKFTALPLHYFGNLSISLRFYGCAFFAERIKFLYLLRNGQFSYKTHIFH